MMSCAISGEQAASRVSRSPCRDEPQALAALPEYLLAPPGATGLNARALHSASAVAWIDDIAPSDAATISYDIRARGPLHH